MNPSDSGDTAALALEFYRRHPERSRRSDGAKDLARLIIVRYAQLSSFGIQ